MSERPSRPAARPLVLRRSAVACLVAVALWAPDVRAQPAQVNQGQASGAGEDALLRGFNLTVDLWGISGLELAPDAYLSQLYVVLTPTYDLGGRHFRGTWAERLRLSGRLFVATEFTGNSAWLRGPSYPDPSLGGPVSGPTGGQPTTGGELPGWTDRAAPERRSDLSDLWLAAFHDKVATLPVVDVPVQAGVRLVLPLSAWSRNVGMIAAPSLYVGVARSLAPVELSYGVRATRSFYVNPDVRRSGRGGPVLVNGREVEPYRPATTGDALPGWLVMQSLNASVSLPRNVTLSLSYSLFSQWSAMPAGCSVEGVPTADTCRDGALVKPRNPGGYSEFGYFLADVTWTGSPWGAIGLGLSTWAPVRNPDGTLGNPFVRVDRNNWTTLYLSLSADAESLARRLSGQTKEPP